MSTPAIRGMSGLRVSLAGSVSRAPLRVAAERRLTLLLLVLDVAADDAHDALAADDLAVFTNPANAAANFHGDTFLIDSCRPVKSESKIMRVNSGCSSPPRRPGALDFG